MTRSNEPEGAKQDLTNEPESETGKDEQPQPQAHREIGGPKGLEPTRYGDWEKGGRCIDF